MTQGGVLFESTLNNALQSALSDELIPGLIKNLSLVSSVEGESAQPFCLISLRRCRHRNFNRNGLGQTGTRTNLAYAYDSSLIFIFLY